MHCLVAFAPFLAVALASPAPHLDMYKEPIVSGSKTNMTQQTSRDIGCK
ncbi:hypothetical protein EYZ11_004981 [Aspergillus tanneri]|uniref:Uncharacterized protein n=1 Tax=Aspergillus tanneri TaxID=1220188 RepID=A0A4S3JJ67_9EURO|nr:hypothetical protein EYZ11_004981 [Aspergillus tanneri]